MARLSPKPGRFVRIDKARKIRAVISVSAQPLAVNGDDRGFAVCIDVGRQKRYCASGRNPRAALAAAFRRAAVQTEARSGAFAGFTRRRKR